jgi:hypothetical protein
MAKVIVKILFHDLQENKLRNQGEEFECSDVRANELNSKGLVAIVSLDKNIKVESVTPTEDKAVKASYKKK